MGYTCEYCGSQFPRRARVGREPKYCSKSHANMASIARKTSAAPDRPTPVLVPVPFAEPRGIALRACTGCGEHKLLAEFNRDRNKAAGRHTACRECTRAAKRQWNADRREHRAEYRKANAQAEREYHQSWRAANRTKDNGYGAVRRARKRGATVEDFTPADLSAAWEDAAIYSCYLCDLPFGEEDEVHIEHVIPLSGGGTHEIANLLPAHGRCNVMKNAADPLEAWQRIQRETHGDAVADARMRYVQAHMD